MYIHTYVRINICLCVHGFSLKSFRPLRALRRRVLELGCLESEGTASGTRVEAVKASRRRGSRSESLAPRRNGAGFEGNGVWSFREISGFVDMNWLVGGIYLGRKI